MTKEEAINKWIIPAIRDIWIDEKCDEIIKALDQGLCDDCISRQAAIDAICKACADGDYYNCDGYPVTSTWCDEVVALRALPSTTPRHKTGHWIKIEPYPMMEHEYKCSECYNGTDNPFEKYCSECGAKMQEVEE